MVSKRDEGLTFSTRTKAQTASHENRIVHFEKTVPLDPSDSLQTLKPATIKTESIESSQSFVITCRMGQDELRVG